MSGAVSAIGDVFSGAADLVGGAISSVGNIVKNVIKNPLPVIETVALTYALGPAGAGLSAAGAYSVSAAATSALNGGDIGKIALAAASAYAGGAIGGQVGTATQYGTTPFSEQTLQLASQNTGLTADTLQAIATSSSGSAASAALMGKPLDQVLQAGAAGAVSAEVSQELAARGIDPNSIDGKIIANSSNAAAKAIMGGKSIGDAIGNATAVTTLGAAVQGASGEVKSAYDSFINSQKTATDYFTNTLSPAQQQAQDQYKAALAAQDNYNGIYNQYQSNIDAYNNAKNIYDNYDSYWKDQGYVSDGNGGYAKYSWLQPGDPGYVEPTKTSSTGWGWNWGNWSWSNFKIDKAPTKDSLATQANDAATAANDLVPKIQTAADNYNSAAEKYQTTAANVQQLQDVYKGYTTDLANNATTLGTATQKFDTAATGVANDYVKQAADIATQDVLNSNAQNLGFKDYADMSAANQAGYTNAVDWAKVAENTLAAATGSTSAEAATGETTLPPVVVTASQKEPGATSGTGTSGTGTGDIKSSITNSDGSTTVTLNDGTVEQYDKSGALTSSIPAQQDSSTLGAVAQANQNALDLATQLADQNLIDAVKNGNAAVISSLSSGDVAGAKNALSGGIAAGTTGTTTGGTTGTTTGGTTGTTTGGTTGGLSAGTTGTTTTTTTTTGGTATGTGTGGLSAGTGTDTGASGAGTGGTGAGTGGAGTGGTGAGAGGAGTGTAGTGAGAGTSTGTGTGSSGTAAAIATGLGALGTGLTTNALGQQTLGGVALPVAKTIKGSQVNVPSLVNAAAPSAATTDQMYNPQAVLQEIQQAAQGGLIQHYAEGGEVFPSAQGLSSGRRYHYYQAYNPMELVAGLGHAAGGPIEGHNPQFFSEGGLGSLENKYVKGPGDGTSDSVPAMLANGEFVIPADVVSNLGNGSNDAGAKVLDKFLIAVRQHSRSANPKELAPDSKGPLAYLLQAKQKVKA